MLKSLHYKAIDGLNSRNERTRVRLGFRPTKLMTPYQLNFLLTARTTCSSAYCQTVTTFSTT